MSIKNQLNLLGVDGQDRQTAEAAFHNEKFINAKKINYYDQGFTGVILDALLQKLGNLTGKKVLEMGCGAGWFSQLLVQRGAEVWAFDISAEAIKTAQAHLGRRGLAQSVHFATMAAEKLEYPDYFFDVVAGKAILHHVDLQVCLPEIARVLKDGGKSVFMEPLGHNPLLNLYRYLTPNLRSRDEMPLRFEQFDIFNKIFTRFDHEEYYLTALFAAAFHFVGLKGLMNATRDVLLRLDHNILHFMPALSRYCWYSVLTGYK
jgi:ubiquinone/menaquinone biosynthesis C-methylase UbiE